MTIKLAPAVRFPGFTDVLEQRKLGELCRIGDIDHRMPASVSVGIPYVMTGDFISNNDIDFENAKQISEEDYEQLAKKIKPEKGDILFARYASVGTVRYVATNQKFLISYSCAILKPNEDIEGKYLYFYIQTDATQQRIELEINTGSQRNIGIDSLKNNIAVSVPKIGEQSKIGTFFQQLDDTIALHQRELDNLKITKQVFMKKMFPKEGEKVPEVRFPGFMADWDYRKLGDVGETYTGLSGKSKDDFGHGRGKYVTYMNVFSNSIANPSLVELVEIDTKQNEVNPGDIFFTTSSETPEEVGMSSVWLENSDNTYLNSFCFGYRPIEKFDNYYLAYMLRSSVVRKKITFLAQGISRYNISKNKVMDIAVPIPVIEEQTKIGEFFKQLDDIINLQQQELEKLKQTKQAFLQKMFI